MQITKTDFLEVKGLIMVSSRNSCINVACGDITFEKTAKSGPNKDLWSVTKWFMSLHTKSVPELDEENWITDLALLVI